jgi:hypothetical protein
MYLIDSRWKSKYGKIYTEAEYIRANGGILSYQIIQALDWMDGIEIVEEVNAFTGSYTYHTTNWSRLDGAQFSLKFMKNIDFVAKKWADATDKELEDYIYSRRAVKHADFNDIILS